MDKPRVSIVIVSFNTLEKLRHCLSCLEPHHELIVVDNASTDGSPEMVESEYPHAKLVRSETNLGFGPANNRGADLATAELVLFLNSDAYAERGAIDLLADVFADKQVAAAGAQLLNRDGSVQDSTANDLTLWAVFCEQTYLERLFPRSTLLSPYWTTPKIKDCNDPVPVEQVMGACLMLRRADNNIVERFDERYFLYCEDTDLCHRVRKHGKIVYVSEAKFVHDLGSSSARSPWTAIARYNAGKELYFQIHAGKYAMFVCWLLDRMGAALRLLVWFMASTLTLLVVKRFRTQAALFWRVLTMPVKGPRRS